MEKTEKIVAFSDDVTIYFIPKEDECRSNYWMNVCLDRVRFQRRCNRIEKDIKHVFDCNHRLKMMNLLEKNVNPLHTANKTYDV